MEGNLVVNNKDNKNDKSVHVMSVWLLPLVNLMFLKLAYLPSKPRFSGEYFFKNIYWNTSSTANQISALVYK